MQLTRNFSLKEFDLQENAPENLRRTAFMLALLILQPLRDQRGPVLITSGRRTKKKNKDVGGSPTSEHLFQVGEREFITQDEDGKETTEREKSPLIYYGAADVVLLNYVEDSYGRLEAFGFIIANCRTAFSQLIWYTETNHFHIGLANNRKQGEVLIKTEDGYRGFRDLEQIKRLDSRL